jgi:putative solute:sodium symporter small subunit
MKFPPVQTAAIARVIYWRRTRRLTACLLAVWFLVTFGVIFFARELSGITLFGWPVSFYMAAQGTILVYVIIVGVYAWRMRQLDKILSGDDTHGA